jgi:hypothetical protein
MWGVLGCVQPQFQMFFFQSIKLFVPLIVPFNPLLLLHSNKLFLFLFIFFLIIFMISYSSTYPTFFTKLHFKSFLVFGSISKCGLDNGLFLYMSPTPHPYFSHQKNIYWFILVFGSISKLGMENWMFWRYSQSRPQNTETGIGGGLMW